MRFLVEKEKNRLKFMPHKVVIGLTNGNVVRVNSKYFSTTLIPHIVDRKKVDEISTFIDLKGTCAIIPTNFFCC